jgi:hypothetical protein
MYKELNFKAWFSPCLRKHVTWSANQSYDFPYVAIVKDQKWQIEFNDFPIEEKYSLYINDKLKVEFSYWPKAWGYEPEKEWHELINSMKK